MVHMRLQSLLLKSYLGTIIFLCLGVWLTSVIGIYWNLAPVQLIFISAASFCGAIFILKRMHTEIMGWPLLLSCLIIAIIQLAPSFPMVMVPPYIYDEVAYTVSLPKAYASARKFFYNSDYGPYSAFPQNYEALTTISMLLFSTPITSKILNIYFAAGIAIATGCIAKLISTSNKSAILASSLIACSPALIGFVPIIKNDIANTFFQAWAIVFLLRFTQSKPCHKIDLMSIGALIGTSIGIKYNSLHFGAIITAIVFLLIGSSNKTLKTKIQLVVIFIISLLIFSCPWYLRNITEFSNPFYPVYNDLFNSHNLYTENYSRVFNELFYFDLENFSWQSGSVHSFISRFSREFGWPATWIGFIGILVGVYYRKPNSFFIISCIALTITLVTIRFGFWEPRYSYILLVLYSALAAKIVDLFAQRLKIINYFIYIFIALNIIYGIHITHSNFKKIHASFKNNQENSFFIENVRYWKVADFLNKNIPKNSKVAAGVGTNQMFYYLNFPYYHIHAMTEKGDLLNIKNEGDLMHIFLKEGVQYLAISDWMYRTPAEKTPVLNNFLKTLSISISNLEDSRNLIQLKRIDDVTIYAIKF